MKQLKHLFFGSVLILAACGGGGGSSSPTITYSGATTQAAVNSSNAKALSIDAYEGEQIGTSIGAIGVAANGNSTPKNLPRLQWLGTTLSERVRQIVAAPALPTASTLAGVTTQADVNGTYSGSYHYSFSADEGSGAFNGTITFSNFRDSANEGSLSGSVSFSGSYNQATQKFTSISITVSSLAVTEAGKTSTVSGTISLSYPGSTERIAMSLVLSDSTTGRTYWIKDFIFTLSSQGTVTLTGTYYDPIHGYVTITTLIPLTTATADSWPTAGQLLFSGINGSKARLTFSSSSYTVEVDATGNGSFVVVR